ncbi:hypothetical protein ES708_31553 [subsurface metagenome]
MTITEAIEIKGRTGVEFLQTDPDEIEEADRLSNEALKRLIDARTPQSVNPHLLLPGETED